MDCRILRSISLKSDGHVSCDDSNGYHINLAEVTANKGWRLEEMLRGALYAHVRSSFAAGRVPWPGQCETCDLYSAGAPPHDTLDREVEIRVEPTLACALRCPSCKRGQEARQRAPDRWMLDPEVLRRLLVECRDNGLAVPGIFYLGWGEPLDHPEFDALVAVGRQEAPGAMQELTTIGNADFRASVKQALLDRIVVSCDGVTQEKYERYRKGGDVSAALRFLQDAKRYAANRPFVEWKYILFDHNDEERDVVAAQELADAFGVDSLLFIITNSKGRSKRFTTENMAAFPLRSPVARVSPAAALQKVKAVATMVASGSVIGRGQRAICHVDRCQLTNSDVLVVEGWALGVDGQPVDRVDFSWGGRPVGTSRPVHERKDVAAVMPTAGGARCGFVASLPAPAAPAAPRLELDVRLGEQSERFVFAFQLDERGPATTTTTPPAPPSIRSPLVALRSLLRKRA